MFIPSGSPKRVVPYTEGVSFPTDWILRFSTTDLTSMWQDEARTIQAAPGDSVYSWNQVGNPGGADVLDRQGSGGSAPTLINTGSRLVVRCLFNVGRLKQNSNAGGSPVGTPVPSGTNDVFTWAVCHDYTNYGAAAATHQWGSVGSPSERLSVFNPATGPWTFGNGSGDDVADATSPAPEPAVVFGWYTGGILHIQVDGGTVYSNDISGAISVNNSSGSIAYGVELNAFNRDVDISEVGMYTYVPSAAQRAALYNFMVSEHSL